MHTSTSGWGLYPSINGQIIRPKSRDEAAEALLRHDFLIARGNGKSYGDAALAPVMLSTLYWNKIIAFDAENGILSCESGALLSDLLPIIVPAGWFFQVTSGIKYITIGGAIAADVHGKNHPTKGCFSNWLCAFELMRADGSVIRCSKTENADLFWQTCGGMGWTGIILSASIQLLRITSVQMETRTLQAPAFDRLFHQMDENLHYNYGVAWLDSTSGGRNFGRGITHLGRHEDKSGEAQNPLPYSAPKPVNIPFFAPIGLLNRLTIKAYNAFYYQQNNINKRLFDLDRFFYPLDKIGHWNRLYGRRGFLQYQFCLPENQAYTGLQKVLEKVQKSGETPFLCVLKRHGAPPPEALNAFPIRGYSLALDFPRTQGVFALIQQLDDMIFDLGGKIYLSKDACSAAKMSRIDPRSFGSNKFSSVLKQRISQ